MFPGLINNKIINNINHIYNDILLIKNIFYYCMFIIVFFIRVF